MNASFCFFFAACFSRKNNNHQAGAEAAQKSCRSKQGKAGRPALSRISKMRDVSVEDTIVALLHGSWGAKEMMLATLSSRW